MLDAGKYCDTEADETPCPPETHIWEIINGWPAGGIIFHYRKENFSFQEEKLS